MDQKNALSLFPHPGVFLHPVVYACTALLLLCLLASIITYILHHSVIRISSTGWHILLNLCFHMALTFSVFAGGINRVENTLVCKSVAVLLHYSSLSSTLWLAATALNIYTQATKEPGKTPDGEHAHNGGRAPVIRFYLVCAGLPLIICGTTASVNLENYGSTERIPLCWMAWEPGLGAFFSPLCLVLLGTCIYLLRSLCTLHKHPDRKYELKSPSQTEPPSNSGQCHSGCPGLLLQQSSSSLANEHPLKAQLCSAVFTLLLFFLSWVFGALSVALWDFLGMIFSCLYGASSVTLGLFVLIHHCAKREDVWSSWTSCCPGHPKKPCQTPNIKLNGDTHSHCHPNPLCQPKSILRHSHCSCRSTELTPVSQCCSRIPNDAALDLMLHANPEIHLHPCVIPIRTKNSPREPEVCFHGPPSGQSSPPGTPHAQICHIVHEQGHPLCHALCHHHHHHHHLNQHHVCCVKEEVDEDEDLQQTHLQIHACTHSRAQQNGIVKAAMHPSDATVNIRTGPWKNETTV